MIKNRDPLREKIASLSSTNNYYATKGEVLRQADAILEPLGMTTGDADLPNDEGRTTVPILKVEGQQLLSEEVASLCYSWYRMPSGRYEATLYIA